MDENQVIHADAITTLRQFERDSIPLVITDPPYGIGYHSNHYKDRNPHAPIANDWDFEIGAFLRECCRVLKDGGALYLFCRWDVYPLWTPAIQSTELKLKTAIVWMKDNWSAGDLTGSFGNQYELILFLTKGRHILRGKRWPNVWQFPRVSAKQLLHPAQKPVPLLARAITASSDPGNLVVDPYAGSGSTGEACKLTERKFLLCDIDKQMVKTASVRLGLPCDIEDEQEAPVYEPYKLEVPTLEAYGVHPEQIAEVFHFIKNNQEKVEQVGLWNNMQTA